MKSMRKQWKTAELLAEELGQKALEISLVWGDEPNKIKWKRITPNDYGKWVEA